MKTKIILFFLLIFLSITGFCKVWTVNNSGNTFAPALITITVGDTVVFNLESTHNAAEVSQLTWNANGNIPLTGGFKTAFGGGMVLPAKLSVGTHYYICEAHISMGMKGIITVQNSLNIKENLSQANIFAYPNPSKGNFQLTINGSEKSDNYTIDIYNLLGEKVYQQFITDFNSEIDMSQHPKGIYFINFNSGQSILTKKLIIQ